MNMDGSISEAPDESDNSAIVIGPKRDTNQLFAGLEHGNSLLMRNAGVSEIRTKRETVNDQQLRNMRHSKKLKKYETTLRRQYRDNERMRNDLLHREKNVNVQGKRFQNVNFDRQVSLLAKAETPEIL